MAETVRRVDRARAEAAQRWAERRRLPRRIRQRTGGRVELVGVEGLHPLYLTSLNRFSGTATGTQTLHPGQLLGLNLTGKGLTVGLWDAGHALTTHQELRDRVAPIDDAARDDHATHVAGTLIASGIREEAQGMAYEARLRSYDWTNDASEMINEARQGLLLSNHSYGLISGWYYGDLEQGADQWYWLGDPTVDAKEDYYFGWYGTEAAQFDRVTFTNPYFLPVVAAGNDRVDTGPAFGPYRALDAQGDWQSYDVGTRSIPRDGGSDGYDSISGAGTAKNVLTIGSVGTDLDNRWRSSPFASYGPTDDGRIKPDLVGYGEHVFSSIARGDDRYDFYSGTSMATPNVTGTLLLLQQHHYALAGRFLRAPTLKGLALHTARDFGRPGPDYQYGWGLLDAEQAARHLTEARFNPLMVKEAVLEEGNSLSWTATVDTPGPLRVTLAWLDPPSAPLRASLDDPTPHLIFDLDLRLIDEATGAVLHPYVLDAAAPDAAATSGDNVVDPVEQIFIAEALPGTYRVVVSHKGSFAPDDKVPFSLLVSGARDALHTVAIDALSAAADVEAVELQWETLFERSKGQFRIERTRFRLDTERQRQYDDTGPQVVGYLDTRGTADAAQAYDFRDPGLPSGQYRYQLFYEGSETDYLAGEVEVFVPPPDAFAVVSNYPNPFTDHTRLVLDLTRTQAVRIDVYDALGRRVALLQDGTLPAGRHNLDIDATRWTSGVYFARVVTDEAARLHRMVVAR